MNYERRQLLADVCLDRFRKEWERGCSMGLFSALHCCGRLKVPIPDWCVEALDTGVGKLAALEAKSLDEVFGPPFRKGTRLEAHKRKRDLSPVVYGICQALIDEGVSVGPGLFEQVSYVLKETGAGYIEKTTVEDYYYFQKKFLSALTEALRDEGINPA